MQAGTAGLANQTGLNTSWTGAQYGGPNMKGPLTASLLLHGIIVLIMVVGIPFWPKTPIEIAVPVSVELVDPSEISRTTNNARPNKPDKPKDAPKPPSPQKKPAPPKMVEETPPDMNTPTPPDLKETPKEIEKPEPPKPLERKEIKEPPKPKKPPPREKVAKKEEPKKDFDSLLKNFLDTEPQTQEPVKDAPKTEEQPDQLSQIAEMGERMTASEEDAIRRQVQPCWSFPIGAANAEQLIVEVRAYMNRDGTVQSVEVLDQGRYNRETNFRAAADAAVRALQNPACTPLKLPPEKYEQWKTIVMNFDPSDML